MKLSKQKYYLASLVFGFLYLNTAVALKSIVFCETADENFSIAIFEDGFYREIGGNSSYSKKVDEQGNTVKRSVKLTLKKIELIYNVADGSVYAQKILGTKDNSVDPNYSMFSPVKKTKDIMYNADWTLELMVFKNTMPNGTLVVNEQNMKTLAVVNTTLNLNCAISPLDDDLLLLMQSKDIIANPGILAKAISAKDLMHAQEEVRAMKLYPDLPKEEALRRMRERLKKAQETAGWTDSSLQPGMPVGTRTKTADGVDISYGQNKPDTDQKN